MANIQGDKLDLINFSIEMVMELLFENDEYFPVATAIDINGKIKPIAYFDGDENPLCEDLITKFQEILDDKMVKSEIRAYAIAYDVIAKRNGESEMTDAVAIKIKHIETEDIIVYFYPYKLTADRKMILADSWGEIQ